MEPFEVMISESQERMCAAVRPERWDAVREVCERWGLPVAVIGRVTDDGDIAVVEGGLDAMAGPTGPARDRADAGRGADQRAIVHERRRAAGHAGGALARRPDRPASPERGMDPGAVLLALLGSPNLASPPAVFEQYDSTVGADTVVGPGHGAAVLRIKGTTKALVATTDGNQAVGRAGPVPRCRDERRRGDPQRRDHRRPAAGRHELPQLRRPDVPEAFWQLSEGVRGLGDACRALGLPVTGGNVSLYNESPDGAIAPTPEIGVVGLLDDIAPARRPGVRRRGRHDRARRRGDAGLAGSAYAALAGAAVEDGPPASTSCARRPLQAFIREATARELVASAQDVSGGGLAVALAEGAMWSGLGRVGSGSPAATSPAVELFGESPSRLVVTPRPRFAPALMLLARQHGLPVEELGVVGGDRLVIELAGAGATGAAEERGSRIADALEVPLADLRHAWDHGLARALGWEAPNRMCGVFGAVVPGGEPTEAAAIATARACSRSSTAARSRPASRSATASS